MPDVLSQIAGQGVLGAFLVLLVLAYRSERQAKDAESAARIKDAQDNLVLVTKLQREVLEAVDKLTDLMTSIQQERRDERARTGGRDGE